MSYINANTILPEELIKKIQVYVDGVNLYIPKVPRETSVHSNYRKEITERNREICKRFLQGKTVKELATEFYLSDKSIYRILGKLKEG